MVRFDWLEMALFNWKVWELYCVDRSWKFLTSIAICVIMCFSFAHPLCNVTKKIGSRCFVDNIGRDGVT